METLVWKPLVLGLSSGLYCLGACVPFLAPCLVAEEREMRGRLFLFGQFLSGRLAGYVMLGMFCGWLGGMAGAGMLKWAAPVSQVALSLLMLAEMGKGMRKTEKCPEKSRFRSGPFWMGLAMGINVCPPLWMALVHVMTLQSMAKGGLALLVFFGASSIFLPPVLWLGNLARHREFRLAARVAGIAVALVFLVYGLKGMPWRC
ncbi:MAG: sulfite exporter TauE/SafE family protein [Verrucomicrobiae bacterium]|nr:sulfite exporter TauE/SafE family protein [Verrucomicrobiae bacterium]